MKIAITGTRGIPNHYGGFEQCAEYLAVGLMKLGHDITVYNSHNHPYQETDWNGVKLVHCYDPEEKIGTVGQFIYDLNCILDLRKKNFDIVLQLGYTSNSIWGWLMPKGTIVTTNMDGLEWKRTKFSKLVKKFLLYAEYLGTKYSDHLISDSIGIQNYLLDTYGKKSTYIAYGAIKFTSPNEQILSAYNIQAENYDMLIARLEPENSIEIILDGVVSANLDRPFLVIGKHNTSYGEYLKGRYEAYKQIVFLGGIYNIDTLNSLRYFSNIYFHGHTVGGTNPSLLEAMASNSLICANDNPFNKYILGNDAIYFSTSEEVGAVILETNKANIKLQDMILSNLDKIDTTYSWDLIIQQYAVHLDAISNKVVK